MHIYRLAYFSYGCKAIHNYTGSYVLTLPILSLSVSVPSKAELFVYSFSLFITNLCIFHYLGQLGLLLGCRVDLGLVLGLGV